MGFGFRKADRLSVSGISNHSDACISRFGDWDTRVGDAGEIVHNNSLAVFHMGRGLRFGGRSWLVQVREVDGME